MDLNAYPHANLDKVLRCLPKALDAATEQAVDRMTLVKAFGYAPTTSEADKIIRSMVRFNLLETVSGSGSAHHGYRYRPTDLARAIGEAEIGGDEWQQLALRALTTPPLFAVLYTRFDMNPPANLAVILKDEYGIPEKGAPKAAKTYSRALWLFLRNNKVKKMAADHDLGPYAGPILVEFGGGARFTFAPGAPYTLKLAAAILEADLAAAREILGEHHSTEGLAAETTQSPNQVGPEPESPA